MTEQQTNAGDAGDQAGRRMTPTERYHELAMSVAGRQPAAAEHALELTRNSKGDVQIGLTVRAVDLAELERDATALFDRLCTKYQRGDTPTPAGGAA